MRLLVDLISCQAGSKNRGIGRYSLELTKAMIRTRSTHELLCMANANLASAFEDLRKIFIKDLPAGYFQPYYHATGLVDELDQKQIASPLIHQSRQAAMPDAVLTTSIFEGFRDPNFVVPQPYGNNSGYKEIVILYDLIPYIYQEQYLNPDPDKKEWYLNTVTSLNNFDLLLTISESTRQDAIQLLDIHPEKAVNISGAVSSYFQNIHLTEMEEKKFLQKMGINRPFVFYLGGNDYRKNMIGALEAYAGLPRKITKNHQFVVNDPGDHSVYRKHAADLGLDSSDLVIFDRVSDSELLILYNLCKVFFFPSLYEGFGLPVLEAMSCGAPTITSNVASLPEIMDIPEALFEVDNNDDVTSTLHRSLEDEDFREKLSQYGVEKAEEFSWEITAKRAWEALEKLDEDRSIHHIFPSVAPTRSKPRIAYLSPLPPQKSGISYYSADLLPHLAEYFNIDLFIDPSLKLGKRWDLDHFSIHPWTELIQKRSRYKTVIYQQGNSHFHFHMLDLEQSFPGIIVLHDFFLSGMMLHNHLQKGGLFEVIDRSHGLKGLIDYHHDKYDVIHDWPMNWNVFQNANEIIVHSEFQKVLYNEYYRYDWKPRFSVIPQLRSAEKQTTDLEKSEIRRKHGIDENAFVLCSFGYVAKSKLNDRVVEGFNNLIRHSDRKCTLWFIGGISDHDYKNKILSKINSLGLKHKVQFTGFVDQEDYEDYFRMADVAVQLRDKSRGETSRAILDSMAFGLPVIINDHGTNRDFDEGVLKISDPVAVEELSRAIVRLSKNETFRSNLGDDAYRYIKEAHSPENVTKKYAAVIERAIATDDRTVLKPLVDSLKELDTPDQLIMEQAIYAGKNKSVRFQSRILVLIQRETESQSDSPPDFLLRLLIRSWLQNKDKSLRIEPVYEEGGNLYRAARFTEEILGLPENSLRNEKQVFIKPGDTLVFLYGRPSIWDRYINLTEKMKENGGKVITVDLCLFTEKDIIGRQVDRKVQDDLCKHMLLESDRVICASRNASENAKKFIKNEGIDKDQQAIIQYFDPDLDLSSLKTIARSSLNESPADSEITLLTKWQDNAIELLEKIVRPLNIYQKKEREESSQSGLKLDGNSNSADSIENGNDDKIITRTVHVGGHPYEVSSDDEYIIDVGDHFEQYMVDMFSTLINANDVVIDVGANIGLTSLYFGEKAAEVHAFEPSPSTFEFLEKNVNRSGLQNISTYNVGLGSEEEELTLTMAPTSRATGFVSNRIKASKGHREENIHIKVGDQLFKDGKVDLLKIDVEGFEMEVLKGFYNVIRDNEPIVVAELNHFCLNIFQRVSVPDYFDFLRDIFPILYAVDFEKYGDLHDAGDRYYVLNEHVVHSKFPNVIGAFSKEQVKRFEESYKELDL